MRERAAGLTGPVRDLRRDEGGLTAVVVVVSLAAIFGAALLSIDAGNLWQTRRNVITATDAAALAEARAAVPSPTTACATTSWTTLLAANAGPGVIEPVACTPVFDGAGLGYVRVEARKQVDVRFGGVLGVEDQWAYSSSTAMVGIVPEAISVRPLGLCVRNGHVQEWLAHVSGGTPLPAPGSDPEHVTGYPTTGTVHHVRWEKQFNDGACGTVPGNWGWIDFDGGLSSNQDLRDWLLNSYTANHVAIGDCNSDNGAPREYCGGDTGAKTGFRSTLDTLVGKSFAIVVFDDGVGSGENATFGIAGFIGVKLWGFRVNGANSERYFDMEFTRIIATGVCCLGVPPTYDFGSRGVRLCAVDGDPVSEEERCG